MDVSAAKGLREKIESKSAVIAVAGMGYVGFPLACALHRAGYTTIGFDADPSKVESLRSGTCYLGHLGGELFHVLSASGRFSATQYSEDLRSADVIILCVPTPLGRHREPDMQFVTASTQMVAGILARGMMVVLESTTYPGTTRGEMLPILESSGLHCGSDFFLAYSPEREDPGRSDTEMSSISKLVGGVDDVSTDLAERLYSRVVRSVHRVSSAEVAEAAKLLENIYRAVNIALMNEMKVVLSKMGIDIWEVVSAAATKPFGFQPFYPGPGLGGHCIPIDPFYLTWKAKEFGLTTKFIELAGEVNAEMPAYVVGRVASALNERSKAVLGSRVLVLGIAYKKNISDVRESPAAEIIELLQAQGADVAYHDPHVPTFPSMRKYQIGLASVELTPTLLAEFDCVVIVADHDAVDYSMVSEHAQLIVDTRNVMAGVVPGTVGIVKA